MLESIGPNPKVKFVNIDRVEARRRRHHRQIKHEKQCDFFRFLLRLCYENNKHIFRIQF